MVFIWKIRQSDSKILSVSPTAGILQPYEAMVSSSSAKYFVLYNKGVEYLGQKYEGCQSFGDKC